ncbi:hypothetical protein DFJ74DRAFT_690980 [Hyaloraphidium curvatum]|nr:hypothetical protein DFJ74DRAFT_690980 [Hyaloraphidium curvatum]
MAETRRIVVGIDLGTSSAKAAAFLLSRPGPEAPSAGLSPVEGCTWASAAHYRTSASPPWTQDSEGWLAAARDGLDVVPALLDASLGSGCWTCTAIALSGQMQDVALIDPETRTSRSAVLYSDTALAANSAAGLEASGAARWLEERTGNYKGPGSVAAKLAALVQEVPARSATPVAFSAHGYVAFALAGRRWDALACDPTTASTTGLVDKRTLRWLPAQELEALVGIPSDAFEFPRLLDTSAVIVGELHGEAGWTPHPALAGAPVVHGAGDLGTTLLGADALRPGKPHAYIGTSGWIAAAETASDGSARGFSLAHPLDPAKRIAAAPTVSAGENVAAWGRALGFDSPEAFDSAAASAPPWAGPLYLPHIRGERFPRSLPSARGHLLDLGPYVSRGQIARAVLEGVAFQFRWMASELFPMRLGDELVLVGGGARSAVWAEMLATSLGVRVARCVSKELDAAVLGAACVAVAAIFPETGGRVELGGSLASVAVSEPARGEEAERMEARFADWLAAVEAMYGK